MLKRMVSLLVLFVLSSSAWASAGGGGASSPYIAMKPPFVINVSDGDKVHHLQLSVSFVPTAPEMAEVISTHEPAIRHSILVLISGKQVSEINTTQGKIQLREQIQEAVNKVLEENHGTSGVERTLFTGFLIQ